jgi:hypothetical protein
MAIAASDAKTKFVTEYYYHGLFFKRHYFLLQFPTQEDATRVGSERLPENWNDRSAGFYSLLYIHPNQPNNMYLIKLIPAASINDDIIMGQILVREGIRLTGQVFNFKRSVIYSVH